MPLFYVNNHSYPELRDIEGEWSRARTWFSAIRHASRCADFRWFVAGQAGLLVMMVVAGVAVAVLFPAGFVLAAHLAIVLGGTLLAAYLQVSLGGDIMRRHLRSVSETARYACPSCGQGLVAHAGTGDPVVRCPECAADIDRAIFEPPHVIPRAFRAFPPWPGSPGAAG
jgi:DNA-directed RNA polymerase subunit RPC12/RpoP